MKLTMTAQEYHAMLTTGQQDAFDAWLRAAGGTPCDTTEVRLGEGFVSCREIERDQRGAMLRPVGGELVTRWVEYRTSTPPPAWPQAVPA